ncbi:MAG TPA: GNAT family protein [Phototrophicaceae bacterium]|nr:GNAT family protein [Phototrophicaceae bacterium]
MLVARKHPVVPDHFETERLLIRAPQPGDGPAINAAVVESIAELRPWMPWAQTTQSVAESETFAREGALHYRNHEDLPMLIFRKSDGLYVGGSGMHNLAWSVPRFEIGYWVRTSAAGQGYITEAVKGIAALAFDKLGAVRLEIRCDARNERSAAVALRSGFTLEARLRKEGRAPDGSLRDTLIFARLRDGLDDKA